MTENKTKPVHRIRVGNVAAAIWANQSDKSGTWYSVTFSRSYRNGDSWKHSDSYSHDDLLILSKVSEYAFEWIHERVSNSAADAMDTEIPQQPPV